MTSGYQRLGEGSIGAEDFSSSETAPHESILVGTCWHIFV